MNSRKKSSSHFSILYSLFSIHCRGSRGVTLIDTVIGSALVLVAFVGIAAVFQLSIDVVGNSRARAGAIALANEWMEYVRSLKFDDVGTIGGIPAGVVPQSETVTLNGISYTRRTTIQFVDDPYDGLGAADTYPTGSPVFVDYKAVRVAISWQSRAGERTVYFVTRVEPQNGIEVACTSSCGTLSVSVVNAISAPVPNANVHVVNTNTVPQIDLTTYTNINGMVVLAGAPVSAGYQVTVSKPGYNSTQTYSATAENPSPTPPHQQVFQSQTTALVFAPPSSGIDVLASKTIYTYSAIATSTWNETFSGTSQIASSTNITIAGGLAQLSGSGSYPAYGELESIPITPSYLAKWRTFSWNGSTPAQTSIAFRFYGGGGVIVPDSMIPGNSGGLSSGTVDLAGVSTSTYPSLLVRARFSTSDASTTPSIDSYAILYDYGPVPRPSTPLHLRGRDKVIGSGPVYKYNMDLQTGADAALAISNLEWDTYEVSFPNVPTQTIAIACNPHPEYLAPGSSVTSRFYLAPVSTYALGVEVRAGGALLSGATTVLSRAGYGATTTTTCGQAYFNYLVAGTYALTVSAPGYQTYGNPNLSVSGTTSMQVTLSP